MVDTTFLVTFMHGDLPIYTLHMEDTTFLVTFILGCLPIYTLHMEDTTFLVTSILGCLPIYIYITHGGYHIAGDLHTQLSAYIYITYGGYHIPGDLHTSLSTYIYITFLSSKFWVLTHGGNHHVQCHSQTYYFWFIVYKNIRLLCGILCILCKFIYISLLYISSCHLNWEHCYRIIHHFIPVS